MLMDVAIPALHSSQRWFLLAERNTLMAPLLGALLVAGWLVLISAYVLRQRTLEVVVGPTRRPRPSRP